jgi:hypothetical protein
MNAKRIGREVALKLFVNGAGQAGDRLVITSKDGKDLGGWGMFPVVDVVAKAIDEARRAERKASKRRRIKAGGKRA